MNIIPASSFQSSVSTAQNKELTSNAVDTLPDTFRMQEGGAVPLSTQMNDRHPLESKLRNWEQTERGRQMEQYRQVFGIAEPMKRVMELNIVKSTEFNPLNTSHHTSIHEDILLNKDNSVAWEDIYRNNDGLQSGMMVGNDVHTKIERSLGI
ncbi:hypothetical protein KAFR_0I00630 [Kazachstania africana CBS 2517]|uniref:Proteasome maturation factor UMP1 n=1 Tax=Kazachstania africana (strain ATCC 22294 / BCRC 22015 / CBS 2517 / CECT 1963 / NBRC 1671 / NRRL Y-8276) TaxID=1071382 RepID=H2AZP4_KAZAF|nr:hypothetical protein KAFR_0I00630 [Kazachstania africana CBS 2517]CCF59844.1 hypothetical protein KAFR_0I00630 [Kazachstania africana CBS 2517]